MCMGFAELKAIPDHNVHLKGFLNGADRSMRSVAKP